MEPAADKTKGALLQAVGGWKLPWDLRTETRHGGRTPCCPHDRRKTTLRPPLSQRPTQQQRVCSRSGTQEGWWAERRGRSQRGALSCRLLCPECSSISRPARNPTGEQSADKGSGHGSSTAQAAPWPSQAQVLLPVEGQGAARGTDRDSPPPPSPLEKPSHLGRARAICSAGQSQRASGSGRGPKAVTIKLSLETSHRRRPGRTR